jgi:hypothetical protein
MFRHLPDWYRMYFSSLNIQILEQLLTSVFAQVPHSSKRSRYRGKQPTRVSICRSNLFPIHAIFSGHTLETFLTAGIFRSFEAGKI